MEKIDLFSDATNQQLLPGFGTDLSEEYFPSDDEPYMNEKQRAYFKNKLICWRNQLLTESRSMLNLMRDDPGRGPCFVDQSVLEANISFKLDIFNRHNKLIQKINDALERIENREYGYCEETGDRIGLKRLEARPIATLSLKAQKWHEQKEMRARMRW